MRRATIKDRTTVIDILSSSFDANKSVNFVAKQDGKRKKRIRRLIEYSFFQGLYFGDVFLSKDEKGAVILLHTKEKKNTLKSIGWDLKLVFTCIGFGKMFSVLKRESLLKKNQPKTSFTHLWYIGVLPEFQNGGIGSALLDKVLEFEKEETIYLETSTLSNIPFYEKRGFKITNTIDLGYDLFVMKKED